MIETLPIVKPRLGFAGVGWIGRNRLQAAIESSMADIIAISDPSAECCEAASALSPTARISTSFNEMINNPELDAVVIATPSAMHMQQAVSAFEKGKAVFCQEPLGRNAAEVEAVVSAARNANRLLGADFSYRYTTAFRKILPLIRSGELGHIYAVELKFHNAYGPDKPWFYDIAQSGGGCVLDLGVHLIDLMLYALDFPGITSVRSQLFAKGQRIRGGTAVEDYADVLLTTSRDTAVHLCCSWHLHAGREAVIEATFYGNEGGVSLQNVNGSFYDFTAQRFRGTRSEVLCTPPDHWGGRALIHFISQLSESGKYRDNAAGYIASANALDMIYERI